MRKTNQTGFSIVEALLILVVIGIIGFTGWYMYHAKQTSDKNYSAASSSTVPTYKKKTAADTADTYAGWKTYISSMEKASFKYPDNWTIDPQGQYASNDSSNKDYLAIMSPDGKVVVRWTSELDGLGNEQGDVYPLNTGVAPASAL